MVASSSQNEMAMQPVAKIVAAVVVVLIGFAVAMLFRRESPAFRPTANPEQDYLVLRGHGEPMAAPAVSWPPRSVARARSVRNKPTGEPATVLAPQMPAAPPPSLAREYPKPAGDTSRWGTSRGMSMEMLLPRPAESKRQRKHTIVDGDTLPELAQRYLGSAERYLEIYRANRDLLPEGPDVLPIGTVLVIPAG